MSRLVRSLAILFAFAFVACGKRSLSEDGGADRGAVDTGAAGSTGGAAAGGNGPGGATGGSSAGGGATAGSSGGTTAGGGGRGGAGGAAGSIAGAGAGGATAGTGGAGGAPAGTGGAGGAPAGTGGAGGATPGTGGAGGATAGTGGNGLGPLRLVIFYTRWGTSYPEWWPTGSGRDFTMSAMLQALEPHKRDIILVSGLTNVNLYASGGTTDIGRANANDMGDAMITLLTARPAVVGGPADGPSLDTVIGDCGGAAGPPLRLAVGEFGYDDNPGVSFGADGVAIRGERDPHAAAMRVLGHDVTAPDPTGDINIDYPALGAAQMGIAAEALATSKACVVTLMWGDRLIPTSLGLTQDVHTLSHGTADLYSAVSSPTPPRPGNDFAKLQRWYAQQFAALLDRLGAIPVGGGTLLDRSVVVWISESGAGEDHTGLYIPVVIAGGGGGRLDVGRFIEVKPHMAPPGQFPDYFSIERTQGDLLLALAGLWGVNGFGDPRIARQAFSDILKP